MSKEKFPLKIAAARNLALPGGLEKYEDILQQPILNLKQMDFIKEWNRVLISILRHPKYIKHLGAMGYLMALLKSPEQVTEIVDGIVPYRSFHYAVRFKKAFDSVKSHSTIVDFEHKLSPLAHLSSAFKGTRSYVIGTDDIINDIYIKASKIIGMKDRVISWNDMETEPDILNGAHFFALGAFVYFKKPKQEYLLKQVIDKVDRFPNFLIELELLKAAVDSNLVSNMGADYNPFGTLDEIKDMGLKNNFKVIELKNSVESFEKYGKLQKDLSAATEILIQR